MKRDILDIRPEKGRRIIAVSDIHAHMGHFEALMEKIGFSDEDFLVIIGDIIECGPDSLGMLRRAMELSRKENVCVLSGNWEDYLYWLLTDNSQAEAFKKRSLSLVDGYGACLLSQMCGEMGIEFGENTDMGEILPAVRERFKQEIEYLGKLPVILDTGDFFFVHGGVPHLDKEKLSELQSHAMMKWDHFADDDVGFDRWLVVGHWPVSLYDAGAPNSAPHVHGEKKIVSIDGGMGKKQDCQLNALIMHMGVPGEFAWENVHDFPFVRALEKQAANENPLHIRWETRKVQVLSREDGLARVRHVETGKEIVIPERFLWDEGWQISACNATDNMLEVEPGDEIAVVSETEMGIFGKKNSITGWYKGKYEKMP